MNARIIKLFAFIAVCFAVLIGFTSQWSVFGADDLRQQTANKRPLFEAQQIKRGSILAADGTMIARSVSEGQGASRQFVRRVPAGRAVRPPDRLQLPDRGQLRVRALPQRRADRSELRVHDDPRRTPRARPDRQQRRHQPRSDRSADRLRPARRPARRGGRDRTVHRQDPGDGERAALRPKPDPGPADRV